MTVCIDGVEVSLGRSEDDPRIMGFYVYVHSRMKPQNQMQGWINPADYGNAKGVLAAIIATAIAGAERLAQKYGDPVDPATVARNAREAMEREMRLMAEMSGGVQSALKLLWEKRADLDNRALEVVERCRWAVNKGLPLSVTEMESVQNIVGVVLSPNRAGG